VPVTQVWPERVAYCTQRRDWKLDVRLVSFVYSIAAVESLTIELSTIRAARSCDVPMLGAGCWESGMLYNW
jgi:hypothetical protein